MREDQDSVLDTRGMLWANECRSKTDDLGNPLSSGDWGEEPGPKTKLWGKVVHSSAKQSFQDLFRATLAMQDCTSVPPPTQC